MLNHVALTGGRVTVSLSALHLGMSTFKVGALIAVFAILPMLFSVKVGRWVDHVGIARPMAYGTGLLICGTLAPALVPSQVTLLLASSCIGIGFMLHQVATQNILGMAPHRTRLRNFSWMSLALGASGFSGPLFGGIAIDHMGNDAAFALLSLGPIGAAAGLYHMRDQLRSVRPSAAGDVARRNIRELIALPALRRILFVNTILSGAWDSHLFIVPIFGVSIGLSGTTIGIILASFAAATFVIRLLLPLIQRRVTSWTLIRMAMGTAAADFMIYPLFTDVVFLIGLSFALGLALGVSQPSILALLHQHSPPGRAAETVGLRMALINGSQVSLPLTFGALGAVIGVAPLFWAYALALMAGGWFNRNPPTEAER
ncbi:MFS transporter [Achromobacter aloeverae]|uniref:MFS transporter n=2 Tax=Achromobacter aloeverae TaxID=1750518 RepID=A0A4Q1HCU1_9BURK|nr:MFS transporter [Achromobacter aloeverae]RXN83407.1 MFS transporter [Achromobacter aloeverae]